jgi:hypothetical protein
MREVMKCESCEHPIHINFKCDMCGNAPCFLHLSVFDTDYDFCNWKCLLKFIVAELRKESGND